MKWNELDVSTQEALTEWYNVVKPDAADKRRLAALHSAGLFWHWKCLFCDDDCYHGQPNDWSHFQGVRNQDYTSFPGNHDVYTQAAIIACCDSCRSGMVEQIPEDSPGEHLDA